MKTTEENNMLIAKFMGFKDSLESKNCTYCRWYHPDNLGDMYFPEQLIYNESWDWLMPVVEKIFEYLKDEGCGYDGQISYLTIFLD